MLTQTEIKTVNGIFTDFLDSSEGFAGWDDDDRLENAWEQACDYACSVNLLGPSLFEKFLKISEENLRECCWDFFKNYFFERNC